MRESQFIIRPFRAVRVAPIVVQRFADRSVIFCPNRVQLVIGRHAEFSSAVDRVQDEIADDMPKFGLTSWWGARIMAIRVVLAADGYYDDANEFFDYEEFKIIDTDLTMVKVY